MTPRHINAPADYWPKKVLAVSSANAAMQNYVSIHEHQTRPNPALAAVHGQAALLLRYEVPAYYVSPELLAAALRTELPDDMVFEAIPFPFDALIFMLPKGTVRHPAEGDCPFLVLSRTSKRQHLSLPVQGMDFSVTAEQELSNRVAARTGRRRAGRLPLGHQRIARFDVEEIQRIPWLTYSESLLQK